jgi:hypothetical protein
VWHPSNKDWGRAQNHEGLSYAEQEAKYGRTPPDRMTPEQDKQYNIDRDNYFRQPHVAAVRKRLGLNVPEAPDARATRMAAQKLRDRQQMEKIRAEINSPAWDGYRARRKAEYERSGGYNSAKDKKRWYGVRGGYDSGPTPRSEAPEAYELPDPKAAAAPAPLPAPSGLAQPSTNAFPQDQRKGAVLRKVPINGDIIK